MSLLCRITSSLARKSKITAQDAAFKEAAFIAKKGTWQITGVCQKADGGIEFQIRSKLGKWDKTLLIGPTHLQLSEYRRVFNSCELVFLPPALGMLADKETKDPYPAMYLTAAIGVGKDIFSRKLAEASC